MTDKDHPKMDLQSLARQWGAKAVPFNNMQEAWNQTPALEKAIERLEQNAALRSALLLHGPNGVGKSALIARWVRALNSRLFLPLIFTQATLSASGLLASLCMKLGKPMAFRRERQLQAIEEALEEMDNRIPVIVLDEAQNYTHAALEEVRLLLGLNLPAQPVFALTLIGDDYLLRSLEMRSHRALHSRLAAQVPLAPWTQEESLAALQIALRQVGLSPEVLEPSAAQQLTSASGGIPRSLQLLARAAWLEAARQPGQQTINAQHVEAALESVPHVPGLRLSNPQSSTSEPAIP